MNYILGASLLLIGGYGLHRNRMKFKKEVEQDGLSFLVYLIDGLFFGTSALFLMLFAIGFAFLFHLIRIQ